MVVGIVDHNVGTRDIRRLGGLMSLMPVTFTIAVIGSFSMAGLPPFNGFLSKEMFFEAMLMMRNLECFSIGSLGTIVPDHCLDCECIYICLQYDYCFSNVFWEHQPDRLDREAHEAPFGMLIAPSILAVLVVGIFFFPNVIGNYLLRPAMAAIYPTFAEC